MQAEAPRTPRALAERLAGSFDVELKASVPSGRPGPSPYRSSHATGGGEPVGERRRKGRRPPATVTDLARPRRSRPTLSSRSSSRSPSSRRSATSRASSTKRLTLRPAWLAAASSCCGCSSSRSHPREHHPAQPRHDGGAADAGCRDRGHAGRGAAPRLRDDDTVAGQHGIALLPVTNLTNLLALHQFTALGLSVNEYVALLWPPALTAILVSVVLLWLLHRGIFAVATTSRRRRSRTTAP